MDSTDLTYARGSPAASASVELELPKDVRPTKASLRERFRKKRSNLFALFQRWTSRRTVIVTRIATQWLPIPPVESSSNFHPSLVAIEATAAAKTYLEIYYNSLWVHPSPRAERLRQLEEQIRSLTLSEVNARRAKEIWIARESQYLRECRALKSLSNSSCYVNGAPFAGYEVIRELGKGSFGVVSLVRSRKRPENDIQLYAMKTIRKNDVFKNRLDAQIRAERDFLIAALGSRWIVQLVESFQTHNLLYLVMEYMAGGDFSTFLQKESVLPEEETRQYVAEMILCVEQVHRLQWIHRDIKPDNFLISASGHLKIADFGLAFDGHWVHNQHYHEGHRLTLVRKYMSGIKSDGNSKHGNSNDQANTLATNELPANESTTTEENTQYLPFQRDLLERLDWYNMNRMERFAHDKVGTREYMAPELVNGVPYDGRCDYWSIGIILYQCLYGFSPFGCPTRAETESKIKRHDEHLYFPLSKPSDALVSGDAIDFIKQLLQDIPYRLGSHKYEVNDGERESSETGPGEKKMGNFVFPDDATEIKTHPFFMGVQWDTLHLRKRSFAPNVQISMGPRHEELKRKNEAKHIHAMNHGDGASWNAIMRRDMMVVRGLHENQRNRAKDVNNSRVSDVRKRTAFLDYTFCRAKDPSEVLVLMKDRI